jgi:hypothetical protein
MTTNTTTSTQTEVPSDVEEDLREILWSQYHQRDWGDNKPSEHFVRLCINRYITDITSTLKAKNEATGKELEKRIVDDINNRCGFYHSIREQFKEKYNKDINGARHVGEKKHYDLVITFTDGSEMKCEVKSSRTKKINKWVNPWHGAVQFLNGTGKQFRIRQFYAREWYEKVMPLLKDRFCLQSDIPDFDEWYRTDASVGGAKTQFGKELHDMSDENIKLLRDIKAKFSKELIVPEKVVNELIEDYNRESKEVLDDKECWLCVHEDNIKLWDKVNSEVIKTITRDTTSKDLHFKVVSKIFNGISIRWQNGSGIANISVQCT